MLIHLIMLNIHSVMIHSFSEKSQTEENRLMSDQKQEMEDVLNDLHEKDETIETMQMEHNSKLKVIIIITYP